MDNIKKIKKMLEHSLEEFTTKADLDVHDIEILDKVLDEIKDIETICAMREAGYTEWPEDGYSRGRGMRGGYYGDRYMGNYYTNGGTAYDGMYMGAMDRRGYGRSDFRPYPQRAMNGYSREDDQMRTINQLERLMNEAASDHVKQAIDEAIHRLEQ